MLGRIFRLCFLLLALTSLVLQADWLVYQWSGAAAKDEQEWNRTIQKSVEEIRSKSVGSILTKQERAELDWLQRSGRQARPTAETFVQAIRAGQTDIAYAMTSAAFQNHHDLACFQEFLRSQPVLARPQEIAGGFNENNNGEARFYVDFREVGHGKSFTVIVVPEGEGFRIDDIRFETNP